ncbi:MAG: DUF3108 domain-containing protein [Gammaproteobacteria bacterium]|nr:DUF3108 domain-containing protein [Gammaproteobacteria bacterium]
MSRFFLILICSIFGSYSFAIGLPPSFTANYEIKKGFLKIGDATRSLKTETNGNYIYTSDSKTTGFIASLFNEHILQSTKFTFENNLIKPQKYFYSRNRGKKNVTQTYDWQKKMVHSQRDNKLFEYSIPDKVQDQSIYQLSLMLDLAEGKRNFTYHIAENVRLVDYQVRHIGSKRIETEVGKLNTVIMQVSNSKITTTIWCAQALNYLPVKIEHEEGGTTFTAYIKTVSGLHPG